MFFKLGDRHNELITLLFIISFMPENFHDKNFKNITQKKFTFGFLKAVSSLISEDNTPNPAWFQDPSLSSSNLLFQPHALATPSP